MVRASVAAPDPAEVCVLERSRELQAVTRHAVHPLWATRMAPAAATGTLPIARPRPAIAAPVATRPAATLGDGATPRRNAYHPGPS
jgi:hypothetical protein